MGKRKTTITLESDLTIEHIKKAREAVLDGISGYSRIEVDISAIEHLDLSGIQLLLTLFRTHFSSKKEIRLKGTFEPKILKVLHDSGFVSGNNTDIEAIENELRQYA